MLKTLTRLEGKSAIYVNPDHVIAVDDGAAGRTRVFVVDKGEIIVTGTAKDVATTLGLDERETRKQ